MGERLEELMASNISSNGSIVRMPADSRASCSGSLEVDGWGWGSCWVGWGGCWVG